MFSHPVYSGDNWHRGSNILEDDLTLHIYANIYANFKASETCI